MISESDSEPQFAHRSAHSSDTGRHITDGREFLHPSLIDGYTAHSGLEALYSENSAFASRAGTQSDWANPEMPHTHSRAKEFSKVFHLMLSTHLGGIRGHFIPNVFLPNELQDLRKYVDQPFHQLGNSAHIDNEAGLDHHNNLSSEYSNPEFTQPEMKLKFTKKPQFIEGKEFLDRQIDPRDLVTLDSVRSGLIRTSFIVLDKAQRPTKLPYLFHIPIQVGGFKLQITTEGKENGKQLSWISPFQPNNPLYGKKAIIEKLRQLTYEIWSLQTRYLQFWGLEKKAVKENPALVLWLDKKITGQSGICPLLGSLSYDHPWDKIQHDYIQQLVLRYIDATPEQDSQGARLATAIAILGPYVKYHHQAFWAIIQEKGGPLLETIQSSEDSNDDFFLGTIYLSFQHQSFKDVITQKRKRKVRSLCDFYTDAKPK
ncbi:hypothetical protein PTTG_27106 [Puccinia triticina 1-1 BBBD Race 1]|uniref:Uncharacterized protein n=1 Tax=Puccinia triticina (isolate 1-1 / race 1 (BBBD)) TaxID=630390 RepID=A0A180GMY9_PUCT1|nr:hypothetical protein PTTG_27106 [Puccinia triticina 1-1 BBBD Race 1]